MIKKFKYLLLILIFTLGIGTTCFGAKSWSINEFTKFIECMGYDVEGMDFSTISVSLASTSNYLKIFRYEIDETTAASKDQLLISFSSVASYFNNGTTSFSMYTGGSRYILDFTNKTIISNNGNTITFYEAILNNTNLTSEEFLSLTYQEYLVKKYCLFSELSIKSNLNTGSKTIFTPQGGKITSSSYGDTVYNGTITYSPTFKTVELNLTSGFISNTSYDLFLERYQLDNNFVTGTGMGAYPLETIDLGDITTADISKSLNLDFALGSMNVYRLCVGVNRDDSGTSNDVFISTDWLLPNSNTLGRYPVFASMHYVQFLDVVFYDPDYGNFPLPYIVSFSKDFVNTEAFVNVYCNIEYDINDYYLTVYKQDVFTGELLETVELSPLHTVYSSLWTKVDETTYHCNLENFYTFDKTSNVSYTAKLFGYSDGYLDATLPFYFKSNFGSNNEVIVKPISIAPYFINEIGGRYNTAYNIHFNLEVADISGDNCDINDYKFLIDTYSFDIESNEFSILYEHVVYFSDAINKEFKDTFWKVPIRYLEVFEDGSEYLYKIHLADKNNNIVDSTDMFYFLDVYDAFFGGSSGTSTNISEFNVLYSKVTSKFGFIDSIKSSIVDFEDIMNGIEPAPSISIDVGATKYTDAKTITVLDLSWYAPYKEYGDVVLTGFIYLGFLWRVFISLPSIINGAGGAVQSQVYVDDISAYNKFGFGRGDGKKHTYPTSKRR